MFDRTSVSVSRIKINNREEIICWPDKKLSCKHNFLFIRCKLKHLTLYLGIEVKERAGDVKYK